MRIEVIKQLPVSFLEYVPKISYDSTTNELILYANKFKLFEHEVEWTEDEKFIPEVGDKVYITEKGLLLVKDNAEFDISQFQYCDLVLWIEKDYQTGELVCKIIEHPSLSNEGEV